MKTLTFTQQLPVRPPVQPPVPPPQKRAAAVAAEPRTAHEPRPTRISRAPGEEALFAYNRQAGTEQGRPQPKIDVYV